MRKILLTLITATSLFSGTAIAQQNCAGFEIKLNGLVKQNNLDAAYPVLQEALNICTDQKINIYNFGETILLDRIENASNDVEKKKYARELSDLIGKRVKYFPDEKKAFWKGEQINYELNYGVIDKQTAYNKYATLFNSESDTQKLSANTVLTYYTTALELMNNGTITFEEVLDVYFQTKKVAEDNIEMRSVEYGELAEKLDSLQQIDPNKKLTKREKQTMDNAQSAKDLFVEVNSSMESILDEYTTCDAIAPVFRNKFQENKDSLEWLVGAYQSLASKDCYDKEIMKVLEERYTFVWKQQNPQSTEGPAATRGGTKIVSSYGSGARKFKAKNYSGAIADFKNAMNEVSGTTRGEVAYYIALSYQKTGSLSNAVSWAKKATKYKKGWGAPYQLIAGIYGSNANSCGSSSFAKQSAYWVAADYANKACAVDSRSCSWARKAASSYESTAPSSEQAFQQGLNKGDRVSVSCFGGASTRVR